MRFIEFEVDDTEHLGTTVLARPTPPGFVEHQCRCAIRDMIEEHGTKLAARLVMQTLDDETARAKR